MKAEGLDVELAPRMIAHVDDLDGLSESVLVNTLYCPFTIAKIKPIIM